jgi:hypothetical protein
VGQARQNQSIDAGHSEQVQGQILILDHLGPSWTILDHLGPQGIGRGHPLHVKNGQGIKRKDKRRWHLESRIFIPTFL